MVKIRKLRDGGRGDPERRRARGPAPGAQGGGGGGDRELRSPAGSSTTSRRSIGRAGEELGALLARRPPRRWARRPSPTARRRSSARTASTSTRAALLHPKLGAPLRAAVGGGKAIIPSAKKLGGPGTAHRRAAALQDAAFVRTHYDAMEIRVPDAPRAQARSCWPSWSPTAAGRIARIGGLTRTRRRKRTGSADALRPALAVASRWGRGLRPRWPTWGATSRRAEDLGFESAVTIDHLLLTPPAYACTWLEPMTMLAALAGVTRTIRLGTMVLVLPLRNPVYFAKEWATLDLLSGGRTILGLGVGWHEDEFALMGVPYRERGPRTSEAIEVLKALWAGDGVTYEGKYYRFRNLTIDPKPVQQPHPPIWIGGGHSPPRRSTARRCRTSSPVLKRIAKYADTWVPHSSATPGDGQGRLGQGAGVRARGRARSGPHRSRSTRTSSGCSSRAEASGVGRAALQGLLRHGPRLLEDVLPARHRGRSRARGSARASPRSTAASIRSSSTRSTGGSSSSS